MTGARGGQDIGLKEILAGLECGVREVEVFKCVDSVGGGFGPLLEPLKERLYLLVQLQCESPCQLQVPASCGRK